LDDFVEALAKRIENEEKVGDLFKILKKSSPRILQLYDKEHSHEELVFMRRKDL
jgi:hypothetical protein